MSEFDDYIESFIQSCPKKIHIKELNTTVYYWHLLRWNNFRKYVFLTVYCLDNGEVITEGIKEGDVVKMLLSVPTRQEIKENDERLKMWEILHNSNKETIDNNPFYQSAIGSSDITMAKQIKRYYNLVDN